jgi:FlaA1/EpsC-like NDP-sugar epimerase
MKRLVMFPLETILGRKEEPLPIDDVLEAFYRKTVLITGAAGSIGMALAEILEKNGVDVVATDIVEGFLGLDVTSPAQVDAVIGATRPRMVVHLAGAKHAGSGEEFVENTVKTNINGTLNIIEAVNKWRNTPTGLVVASTCKAIEPETVYGATKLICERATLNAGHAVARFFNVAQTSGNVFEIWSDPTLEEYLVTNTERYFISLDEAVSLVLNTMMIGYGRWIFEPEKRTSMIHLANKILPGDKINIVPNRRGDRIREPIHGEHERLQWTPTTHLTRVTNYHD